MRKRDIGKRGMCFPRNLFLLSYLDLWIPVQRVKNLLGNAFFIPKQTSETPHVLEDQELKVDLTDVNTQGDHLFSPEWANPQDMHLLQGLSLLPRQGVHATKMRLG